MINHDYINNFNLSFSSVLKVILQTFKLYKNQFEDVAYKVQNAFEDFIPSMKYERYLDFEREQ